MISQEQLAELVRLYSEFHGAIDSRMCGTSPQSGRMLQIRVYSRQFAVTHLNSYLFLFILVLRISPETLPGPE